MSGSGVRVELRLGYPSRTSPGSRFKRKKTVEYGQYLESAPVQAWKTDRNRGIPGTHGKQGLFRVFSQMFFCGLSQPHIFCRPWAKKVCEKAKMS
jgi:hypothetical protein